MNGPRHRFQFNELRIGNVLVDGMAVAYVQHPVADGGHAHWYLGADADGVAIACPMTPGPMLAAVPRGPKGAIQAELGRLASGPRETDAGRIAKAYRQGPWTHVGRITSLDWLIERGLHVERGRGGEIEEVVQDALAPLTARLGMRTQMIEAHVDRKQKSYALRPTLDRDGVTARILTLTRPAIRALSRVQPRSLLHEVMMMPGIDVGKPIGALVRDALEELGAPAAAARRFVVHVEEGAPWTSMSIVRALRSLPVDWIPPAEDSDGWESLAAFSNLLESHGSPESEWRTLLASGKGDWQGLWTRCARAALGPDVTVQTPSMSVAFGNSRDLPREFAAFLKSTLDEGEPTEAVEEVARLATDGGRSLPAILENSRNWHRRFQRTPPRGIEWEPILPAWTDPETGIEVVPLTSSDALVEEGEAMRHCVGGEGYALGCLRDRIRILSLRREGKRLSTAEISLTGADGFGNLWDAAEQHLAEGNADPEGDAVAALLAYLSLPESVAACAYASPNDARMPQPSRADAEAALDRWRPYLGGPWRRASLDDLLETVRERSPAAPAFGGP